MLQKKKKLKLCYSLNYAIDRSASDLYMDKQGFIYFMIETGSLIYCCNEDGSIHHVIDLKQYVEVEATHPIFLIYNERIYIAASKCTNLVLLCLSLEGGLVWCHELGKQFNKQIDTIMTDGNNNILLSLCWRDKTISEKIAYIKGNWRNQLISISLEGKENWIKEIWSVDSPIILDATIIMYEEFCNLVGYQLDGKMKWCYAFGRCRFQNRGNFWHNGAGYLVVAQMIQEFSFNEKAKILKINKEGKIEEIFNMLQIIGFNGYTVNDNGMLYMKNELEQLVKINLEKGAIEAKTMLHGNSNGIHPPVYDQEGNIYILTQGKGHNSYLEVFDENLVPICVKKLKGEAVNYIRHRNGKIYVILDGRTKYPSYLDILEVK